MIFTALSKSNKISIYFIVLLIMLMSESALALDKKHRSILKQLTLQEYRELNQKLEEKGLYREAERYIDDAMANADRKKRYKFLKNENKEIAKTMGVKASATKFGIPYSLLRTFNLVQVMIHFDTANRIGKKSVKHLTVNKHNRAARVVRKYARKLLARSQKSLQKSTNWISVYHEDRAYQHLGTNIIRSAKNKDFDIHSIDPFWHPYNLLHVLRNGEFVLTDVNIIRKGTLKDGDKIISPNDVNLSLIQTSTTINSASKAREIYIAVNKLQAFLNKKYPDKFSLTINDSNMFEVSLDFVAPYGWWKDAFFRVVFNFDNIGTEGPDIDVEYAPRVSHLMGNELCLMQSFKSSKRFNHDFNEYWWSYCSKRVRYGSDNFSIEEQILNIINFMLSDLDIRSEGILAYNFKEKSPRRLIAKEIIRVNNRAQKVHKRLYVETDHDKIKKSVRKRIKKDGEDPTFDYLVIDDEFNAEFTEFDNTQKDESTRTDIFIPVQMYAEAKIVEFDYLAISNIYDLIDEARMKSGFAIPERVQPVVYYKNQKLGEHNFQQVLDGIRIRNSKARHKRKHDFLTMIVKVPGYEKHAFENAIPEQGSLDEYYYIPENPRQLTIQEKLNESKLGKPIEWEIHLFENKKLAKANNMIYQYKLILPVETQQTTERFRGGSQYGNHANVWIPTIRDDMSEIQKKFALMSMFDLSSSELQIPSNLKKGAVSNFGNNIITKSLFMPKENDWVPTQAYLALLLQQVQMSSLITRQDYSIAEANNVFFEHVINGNIDKNIIKDLAYFVGYLAPSLSHLSGMSERDKEEFIHRIVINYLIEICVRTLLYNEFDATTGIIKELIKKPEQFSLESIYTANPKGISLAFNVLQITDFLITKIVFDRNKENKIDFTVYESEVESLQSSIKSIRNILDGEKNLIPVFLRQLLPVASYYSDDMDFESNEFLDKFTLSVLENYRSRTKNNEVKATLHAFLKNTEQKSEFFCQEKTNELISLFRKNTPELLINAPNEQGGFRQTCYHCRQLYETRDSIRGKGRTKNRTTGKPKKTLVRPFHEICMEKDRYIRQQAGKLFKKMEKSYPKKQRVGPDYHYNPVPDGFELIRINGDGNCMYSSIAEIFNRNIWTRQAGPWNQQKIRKTIDYNLRQIYFSIDSDEGKLVQELELLLGIDAGMIPAILNNKIITDSDSFAQSELGRLQQFGDAQLIALLVPTQGVWFPVITQGHNGSFHEMYDLRRWVNLAPNLLAVLLQNENYKFPDLTERQRGTLLQLLLSQNFDQAKLFVSQIMVDPHQSSAYLIHYPSSVALMEHFDAAVSIEAPQNMAVNLSRTTPMDETLQDSNPLSLMIQTSVGALLTTPGTPTSNL
ncbi:hypothetical protein [Endozoicomonas sp. 4G]|uniref:hypothetical protein n=1 Tax=Endozoicomonas sp. 4G TaxID=2872754 RepID=UPI002078BE0C|nr:hypothetical protein [Endozoicomonas sp. 4G]